MKFHKNFYLLHKWQNLIEAHDASDLHSQFECSKHALIWAPGNDPHNHGVTIVKQGTHAHYHGLMTCGGVWGCPVCAAAAMEDYYYKTLAASEGMIQQGYSAVMVTFTIPHKKSQSAASVLKNLIDVYNNFHNQHWLTTDRKDTGFGGNIRALETTYGDNGWHWHYHIVMFFNNLTAAQAEDLEASWQWRWYQSCLRVIPELTPYYPDVESMLANTGSDGVHFSRKQNGAIWIANDAESAARYICNSAKELTGGHHKGKFTGHNHGWHITPLDMLNSDNPELHNLYFEYVRAAKGKFRVYISPYVRRRCGVDVNTRAKELHAITAENFTQPEVVCRFGDISWSEIVTIEREQKIPLRAIILVQAINGGAGAVVRLCSELGVTISDITIPQAEEALSA